MPKMTKVFGPERLNLMLPLRSYLIDVQESTVAELSKRFGYSEAEIREALITIDRIDLGATQGYTYMGPIFWVDNELLEATGQVVLRDHNIEAGTPKLSVKQVAAISAGLQMLMSMPHFEHIDEAKGLLEVFSKTPTGATQNRIAFEPLVAGDKFDAIREAILDSNLVAIDYIDTRGRESRERLIAPLKLQAVELNWYLHAWDISKDEHRLFKLDGITRVTVTADAIPAAVLEHEVPDSLYEPDDNAIAVAVRVESDAYRFVTDFYGKLPSNPSGTIETEVKVSNLNALAAAVASFGGSVTVLGPDDARAAVRDYVRRVLKELN